MIITQRHVTFFLLGIVVVGAVIAGAWKASSHSPASLSGDPDGHAIGSELTGQRLQALSTCPLQAAIPVTGAKDGQFPLQTHLAGLTATEIASFLVIGKEAASAGRLRDAETAFLMSCRVADKFKGAISVESADAKRQLGGHYAKAVVSNGISASTNRVELLWRAQLLLVDSLNAYAEMFGESHDKVRLAAQELGAVRQSLAEVQTLELADTAGLTAGNASKEFNKPVPVEDRVGLLSNADATTTATATATAKTQPRKAELAKAQPVQAPSSRSTSRTGPSFNCARAGSVSEKLICSDPELAQLDRELARVYARAKYATSDRAAFRRRQDQEWLKRESTCRDRSCLLSWYSVRREQLIRDIEGRSPVEASASR